eukprot:scaffold8891_cov46-Cyclotella_meneghiniana.AAC.1
MQQHRPSSPDSVVELNAVLADEEASAPELRNRWDSESDSDSEDVESTSTDSVVAFNAVLADEEASAPELGNRWDSASDSD